MMNALEYLGETDQAYADYKASVLRCEILCRRTRARAFVEADGSVDLRKAKAEAHPDVEEADKYLVEATLFLEGLKARRERADIVIQVFRTLEASRRKN
jgi:hypothetical protein